MTFSVSTPLGDSKWNVVSVGNEQVDIRHPDGTCYTVVVFDDGMVLLGEARKRGIKLSKTLFGVKKKDMFKEEDDAPSKTDSN